MRTMNTRDPVTEVSPVYLVNMFEYLLTSGFDFSDVLTAVKSGIVQIASSARFNLLQDTETVQITDADIDAIVVDMDSK